MCMFSTIQYNLFILPVGLALLPSFPPSRCPLALHPFSSDGVLIFLPFLKQFLLLAYDKYLKRLPTSNNAAFASIILPVTC
jgi:hypothetical protein